MQARLSACFAPANAAYSDRKADQNITTVRLSPAATADKARELEKMGWEVYVTDAAGSRFTPPTFDQPLMILQEVA
jgi:hypothetical protein